MLLGESTRHGERRLGIESSTTVFDFHAQDATRDAMIDSDVHAHLSGSGMARDVRQGFLNDAVHRDLDVPSEPLARETRLVKPTFTPVDDA